MRSLMKRSLELGLASLLLGTCSLCRTAQAQQNAGFSIDRFDPAERGSAWFAADSLDMRGHGRLILGATGDWGYKPLVLYAPNGDEQQAVIEHQFFAHLGADVLLADRLRLGVNLPIALYQAGQSATVGTTTFASNNSTTLGDLRVSADLRLFGEYRGPVELAIGVAGYLPTGSKDSFTGDGKARIAPRALLAGELGAFVYAARAGFLYRANDSGFAGVSKSNEVFGVAAVGLRVADERLVVGPELYGSTSTANGDAFFGRRTSPFEVLFGGHYLAARDFRVGLGVGPGLTRGVGAPELRFLASLEWVPEVEKPVAAPRDRDQDGILDAADACPDEPGVKSDDPKTNGCPPPRDRDKDGIVDELDACPDAPGPANEDPRKNGCPAARIEQGQIKILERVEFENNSAKIRPESERVLNAVLDVMRAHPEFNELSVEGHTDNRGAPAYNKHLSQQRAASVMKWLVDHGIAKSRLSAQGLGLEKPIDSNDTDAGRQNNRRVEFHILEVDGRAAVEVR